MEARCTHLEVLLGDALVQRKLVGLVALDDGLRVVPPQLLHEAVLLHRVLRRLVRRHLQLLELLHLEVAEDYRPTLVCARRQPW